MQAAAEYATGGSQVFTPAVIQQRLVMEPHSSTSLLQTGHAPVPGATAAPDGTPAAGAAALTPPHVPCLASPMTHPLQQLDDIQVPTEHLQPGQRVPTAPQLTAAGSMLQQTQQQARQQEAAAARAATSLVVWQSPAERNSQESNQPPSALALAAPQSLVWQTQSQGQSQQQQQQVSMSQAHAELKLQVKAEVTAEMQAQLAPLLAGFMAMQKQMLQMQEHVMRMSTAPHQQLQHALGPPGQADCSGPQQLQHVPAMLGTAKEDIHAARHMQGVPEVQQQQEEQQEEPAHPAAADAPLAQCEDRADPQQLAVLPVEPSQNQEQQAGTEGADPMRILLANVDKRFHHKEVGSNSHLCNDSCWIIECDARYLTTLGLVALLWHPHHCVTDMTACSQDSLGGDTSGGGDRAGGLPGTINLSGMLKIVAGLQQHGAGMDSQSVVLDAGGGTGW
jgi:hypothetical protein